MTILTFTPQQLRAILWMNDVEGIVARPEGDDICFFYEALPSFWEQKISREDVATIIANLTHKLN